MERLSFDTTFLIDLQRERHRKGDDEGAAHRFLKENADASFEISSIALGEYAEGIPPEKSDPIDALLRSCDLLPIDTDVALAYGEITRTLRKQGLLIGANDLWIAATSIRHQLPLVTRNASHFKRVPGIQLMEY